MGNKWDFLVYSQASAVMDQKPHQMSALSHREGETCFLQHLNSIPGSGEEGEQMGLFWMAHAGAEKKSHLFPLFS